MSRITELEDRYGPGHDELIFPCDCGDGDFLRITWDDDDPEWRWLWIEHRRRPRTVGQRVAQAWRALRGRESFVDEVVLTQDVVEGLRSFLAAK